jgi:hypothetical protein
MAPRFDFALHNFVKISSAHRMTPAMAACVDSLPWKIGDILKGDRGLAAQVTL